MLRLAFEGRRRQLAAANPCGKPRFAARSPRKSGLLHKQCRRRGPS